MPPSYSDIIMLNSLTGDVAHSMNPEERPNLQDYKDKESANTNTCQDCNKVFLA